MSLKHAAALNRYLHALFSTCDLPQ